MARLAAARRDFGATIGGAAAKVEAQRARIATMRFDDPCLTEAFALLRQLEQSLTLAELDCVFVRFSSKQPSA